MLKIQGEGVAAARFAADYCLQVRLVLHHRDLRIVATPSESFLRMWQSLGELHLT
jgi:hypothetical protein